MTVLIVEDNAAVSGLLKEQLVDHGFSVTVASNSAEARGCLATSSFNVVILAGTLPDGSGLRVLEELRSRGDTAHVIVLSGAVAEADRVQALSLGADDYVTKPFFARELTARVLAVRRRRTTKPGALLNLGGLQVDLAARMVLVDRTPLELTAKEFDLLAFMAARPGHVFSRDELLRAVWNSSPEWQQTKTVTEHIRRLRAKIEANPMAPRMLRTVRNAGYRFDPPHVAAPPSSASPAIDVTATVYHDGGVIVSADEPTAELLGVRSVSELIGRDLLDFVSTAFLSAARASLKPVMTGSPEGSQRSAVTTADGRSIPVIVTSSDSEWRGKPARKVEFHRRPSNATDPALPFGVGIMRDLTEAVIVTDPELHIRKWNSAAQRFYGWSESEVLGRNMRDVVEWAGDPDQMRNAWQVLQGTGRWHGHGIQVTRDGGRIDVTATTTMIRDGQGAPLGIVSVNRLLTRDTRPAIPKDHEPSDAEIRRGLANGEFEVYYQPVVRMADHRLLSVEALVRWNHPTRGLLTPAAFLGAAERTGSILEIGRMVFPEACRRLAEWRKGGADIDVAVNLSGRELTDPDLFQRVHDTVMAEGLDPGDIWLEVTETSLVEDVDEARNVLTMLAEFGVGIALDDFGTGWASLTYLREFPVHTLKIDRTFVSSVDLTYHDAAIARSTVSLGRELELFVVAEGVETSGQEAALMDMGCQIGQGFLYGRPTPASAVPLELADRIPSAFSESVAGIPHSVRGPSSHETLSTPTGSPQDRPPEASVRGRLGDGEGSSSDREAREGSRTTTVETALRGLLRIRTAAAAAELLQQAAERLGGTLAHPDDAGDDGLPIDLSLGEGPPIVVTADRLSPARMRLEAVLPRLVEDARRAVELLRRTESRRGRSNRNRPDGLVSRQMLDRALPQVAGGMLVMIGLDHFEEINDSNGRAAGDRVLELFGSVVGQEVDGADVVCRTGGDEFLIVSAKPEVANATDLVHRIRMAWARTAPYRCTFSAGIAPLSEVGGAEGLLAADSALTRAKRQGRNRTEVASGSSIDPRAD